MPGITSVLDDTRDDNTSDDSLKLWLPSEVSAEDRDTWCLPDIPSLEFRFRYAQADDSLAEVRRLRRLVQGLQDQNSKHPSRSQKNVTRSQGLFEGFKARISRSASRYTRARDAMLALDPGEKLCPGWKRRFQKLNDSDIRGPGRATGDSEGQFVPSWIWLVPRLTPPTPATASSKDLATTTHTSPLPDDEATTTAAAEQVAANDAELANSMRVHWAKCQARAERYEEEVALTVEEMGRTLSYFEWKRSWWLTLGSEREKSDTPTSAGVQRGLNAYAHRQASIYETLVVSFVSRWRKSLLSHKLNPPWLSQYPVATDPLSSRPSRGHSRPETQSTTGTINCESGHTGGGPHSSPPPQASEAVDPPLASEVESDDESDDEGDDDYVVDEVEGFDLED